MRTVRAASLNDDDDLVAVVADVARPLLEATAGASHG
jgi:hypothetical protein